MRRRHCPLAAAFILLIAAARCVEQEEAPPPCPISVVAEFSAASMDRRMASRFLEALASRCHARPPKPLTQFVDLNHEWSEADVSRLSKDQLVTLAEAACSATTPREAPATPCWREDPGLRSIASQGCWAEGTDLPAWAIRGWLVGEGAPLAHADAVARALLKDPDLSGFRTSLKLPASSPPAPPLTLARTASHELELTRDGVVVFDSITQRLEDVQIPRAEISEHRERDHDWPQLLIAVGADVPTRDVLRLLQRVASHGHQQILVALDSRHPQGAVGVVSVDVAELGTASVMADSCRGNFGSLLNSVAEPSWGAWGSDCAPPKAGKFLPEFLRRCAAQGESHPAGDGKQL